ncbi:hypothetical protein RSOLAG22IIIB_01903 [Rhizoctonia solani]|uniref:Uncharacterized protein n=1 Tax=Rhizoctonia solani TaxID=456999 RepID=A0A0K6GBA5_9AGAM|nr:hypothetical protein RSOLAG22IIIB_01903 [Rhizoctonia solani]
MDMLVTMNELLLDDSPKFSTIHTANLRVRRRSRSNYNSSAIWNTYGDVPIQLSPALGSRYVLGGSCDHPFMPTWIQPWGSLYHLEFSVVPKELHLEGTVQHVAPPARTPIELTITFATTFTHWEIKSTIRYTLFIKRILCLLSIRATSLITELANDKLNKHRARNMRGI